MAIGTEGRQQVDYFIGIEVENTPMKGVRTLFVVGVKPVDEIISKVNNLDHIYLGTSQSFKPSTLEDWQSWSTMINKLLDIGYWVTLDFDVKYANEINEMGFTENNKFIPMISVKIPHIKLYNYNAVLKIDDNTWGETNPGVWCHYLHDLMKRNTYTDWREYEGDTPV
jgi:hypothetical protein